MPDTPHSDTDALERADAAAREHALDVTRSFLVQAPAGSGKTGLLIQRFLALLGHVDRPERVVAITFTRKAATEMRERVLDALREAEAGGAVDPARGHDVRTRELAQQALAQDRRCGWNLILQPARLRMTTIDALATALARRAPVATALGALPAFRDDAWPLYAAAAADTLADARADDAAWRRFLLHVDNDADRAVDLLSGLLAKRDQWLLRPVGGNRRDLRGALERALCAEIDAVLVRVGAAVPDELADSLSALAGYAGENLAGRAGHEVRSEMLKATGTRGGLPPARHDAADEWRALADWLLVKNDARFRVAGTTADGFPAAGTGAGAASRAERNREFKGWLMAASAVPGLAHALAGVRALPPTRYGDDAWAFVEATLELLRRCAAHLLDVFAREGAADFAEATLRALAALGEADDPGELLLALDYSIAHLLVDEFQDTSWSQLQLIARLTSGWEEGDGRTLFAVGDPMQSIYRFREAEVGIFVAAQRRGRVAGIGVDCLDLARNFRSQRPIVDWVNRVFPRVLPEAADEERGEVAYKPVLATRDAKGEPGPTVELVADAAAEAAAVVGRVRSALSAGAREVAILVRARPHLDTILPALRAAGIDYAALDLESLAERLATRDLTSLARTLIQPADRLAACAVLRAPWCGLALADLLSVAEGARDRPILAAACDPAVVAGLSADGARRLGRVAAVLTAANAARGQGSLTGRVRAAWLALGGPACTEGELDLIGAERFFALLATHESGGDVPDWDAFVAATARLYAEPTAGAAVQVMTLHKAKGLEFDTVILPGLGRGARRSDDELLRWKTRERHGEPTLLLAPLSARAGARREPDPVYAYLRELAIAEEAAELGRLLYVGCTRARRRLHLIATAKTLPPDGDTPMRWRAPTSGSSLAALWPAVAADVAPPLDVEPPRADGEDGDATPEAPPLLRLPEHWSVPPSRADVPGPTNPQAVGPTRPAFEWAQATAAAVGVVAHRLFAQIAREGILGWDGARIAAHSPRIRAELAAEGVAVDELAAATGQVDAAVRGLLGSERGRWLLRADHADAHSEWALTGVDGDAIAHVVVDRSFAADGARWIVDFKTGTHEGADLAEFLDREVGRYRDQLERYARIVAALDARPIRLALYYPRLDAWREWAWAPHDSTRASDAAS